jgi:hypothetical protein
VPRRTHQCCREFSPRNELWPNALRRWCRFRQQAGPFDSASASQGEATTPLRMTGLVAYQPLPHIFSPTLQRLLHECHELVGDGAVNQAMVVAQGEVNDGTDGN